MKVVIEFFFLIFLSFFFFSCGSEKNYLDNVYSSSSLESDLEKLYFTPSFSKKDYYLLRYCFTTDIGRMNVDGKTYSEILKETKLIVKNKKAKEVDVEGLKIDVVNQSIKRVWGKEKLNLNIIVKNNTDSIEYLDQVRVVVSTPTYTLLCILIYEFDGSVVMPNQSVSFAKAYQLTMLNEDLINIGISQKKYEDTTEFYKQFLLDGYPRHHLHIQPPK